MSLTEIFILCGGLGLFLFGMNLMSEGFEKFAGDRLRGWLSRLTSKRVIGIIVGMGVTAIIQSSSATTVMVVGFVNASLMTLRQAIGVIMGANIGTTVTGVIIAVNLADIAPIILLAGVVLNTFFKRRQVRNLGLVLLGFGMLFVGITLMGDTLQGFRDSKLFIDVILSLRDPFIGMLVGMVMTSVIQSSSAFTGILITLAASGMITFEAAFPMLLGTNIGTCATAMLASIGTNYNARRAALMHVLMKAIGATVFLLLSFVIDYPRIMAALAGQEDVWQISLFHVIFNIGNTILFLPFANMIVRLVERIIPTGDSEELEHELKYINDHTFSTPPLIVTQFLKELERMQRLVDKNLQSALAGLANLTANEMPALLERENTINFLNHQMTPLLVKGSAATISPHDSVLIGEMFRVVVDLERVGDHAKNIMEYAEVICDHKLNFSEDGRAEMKNMADTAMRLFVICCDAYFSRSTRQSAVAEELEQMLDNMQKLYKNNHILRLNKNECDPRSSGIFTDIITDIERIGDHSINILHTVLEDYAMR